MKMPLKGPCKVSGFILGLYTLCTLCDGFPVVPVVLTPRHGHGYRARAARLPGLSAMGIDHKESSEGSHTADDGRRRWLGSGIAAALASMGGTPASAFCGDPFPSWAYFIKFDEAALPVSIGGNR